VAIGGAKYAAVATSAGYLRTFSPTGLQGPIINLPGCFVSMCANGNRLFLLHADEFSSELSFSLYNMDQVALLASGHVGGRFKNMKLVWIGLNDNNIAGIFDEQMVLHICNPNSNYSWHPWLDCKEQREKNEVIWPISFTLNELLCLHLQNGEGHPEPIPRPMPTVIPMRIPFLGLDDPIISPYEKPFRINTIFRSDALCPTDMVDREIRKLHLVADKHVLELIQLAIKADKPARILELCPLFLMEKSWDMAIQLVRHNRLVQLADRIEQLRDQADQSRQEPPPEKEERRLSVRTPKLPSKISMESPGTTLANLTPISRELTGNNTLFPVNALSEAQETLLPEIALDSSAASTFSNPFAQVSLNTPRTEAKARSFTEMMRTVQQAAEIPTKKMKSEPSVDKKMKQIDISKGMGAFENLESN
jgi:hypothetical protein